MNRSCLLFLLLPFPALAGAWLQEDGGLLVSTQALYYQTDSYFDVTGEELAQRDFTKQELNLYTEYGWSEKFTLGANLFINRVEQGDDNFGIADPEFFARATLFKTDNSVISIQPLIKLPSLYQYGGSPRGGTDSFDGELSLLYGRNMPIISARDYMDMRVGYRERSDGLNGQYRVDVSYGLYVTDYLLCVPAFRSVIAAKNDAQTFNNNGSLDYDLYKAEMSLYYPLNDFQQVGMGYFHHIAGQQTGAGQGFSIGLVQRF
jgi:hypothetical protein